jgi:hypothetical protein
MYVYTSISNFVHPASMVATYYHKTKSCRKFPPSSHQKLTHTYQKLHIFQRSTVNHHFRTQKWHYCGIHKLKAIPWLRQSCQHLTMESLVNPRPVHVGFVMGKVALGQEFHQVLLFYPLRMIFIIPPEWHESIQVQSVLWRLVLELTYQNSWGHNPGDKTQIFFW